MAAVPVDKEIIVVDDGSTDGTREILQQAEIPSLREGGDIKVILKEKNGGKGSALREGLKSFTGDYVVFQDADLEYSPSDYLKMLRIINQENIEVVYGSRFLSGSNKFLPLCFIANRFLTLLVNFLFRSRLTDMETCYKMFKKPVIDSISLESMRFEIEVELTCKILKKGIRIYEVPISYRLRDVRGGKKIGFADGLQAVASILRYRIFI